MYFQSLWWDHWPEMAITGMHRQENQKWKNRGKLIQVINRCYSDCLNPGVFKSPDNLNQMLFSSFLSNTVILTLFLKLCDLSNQFSFPLEVLKLWNYNTFCHTQFTVLVVFHFCTELFCRKYYLQHGFGDPVVLKEGVLCAERHSQVKELCRTRIEAVTTSGMVS